MKRSLLIPLLILAALLVVYLIIDSARNVTYQPKAFVDVDTSKIDAVSIHSKDTDILLKRVAGSWRLAEPVDYPAETKMVDDLIGKLGKLEIETLISEDPAKDSLFQVDTSGTQITISAGSDTVARMIMGKPSDNYRHTYCRKVGDKKIYLIKGTFSSQLNRKAKDWRDKAILEMDQERISRIDFQYPKESFSLAKHDTLWYLEVGDKSDQADKKMVDRVLSVLSRFRTYDFVDGDTVNAVDFTVPGFSVTVTTDNGDIYNLAFVPLERDKEANRYLVRKKGVDNTLFVIYKGSANAIMQKAEDFKEKVKATTL